MLAKKPSKLTFENNQNQPDITEGQESFLPVMLEDVGQGDTVDDTDGDLADDAGVDDLCGEPFCEREEEKE